MKSASRYTYLGQDADGKKRYKQFKTEEDASTWIENELNRQREHGELTANLDGVLVATWNRMDKELKALGSSLEQAGSEIAKRLKSVRKEGTAKACLDAFIASKIKQGRKPAYISDIKSRCLRFLEEHPPDLLARSISPELTVRGEMPALRNLTHNPKELVQIIALRRHAGAYANWKKKTKEESVW